MNGSGNPVGGIEPETTAMFNKTWIAITAAIPKQRKAENLLSDFKPTLKMLIISVKNTKQSIIQPNKPNSSATIEKMKSLSLNGRNNSACLELNKPTPQTPPLPIA